MVSGPVHTCISEPLDRPRALASSVVRPLLSVLLTAQAAGSKKRRGENNQAGALNWTGAGGRATHVTSG